MHNRTNGDAEEVKPRNHRLGLRLGLGLRLAAPIPASNGFRLAMGTKERALGISDTRSTFPNDPSFSPNLHTHTENSFSSTLVVASRYVSKPAR